MPVVVRQGMGSRRAENCGSSRGGLGLLTCPYLCNDRCSAFSKISTGRFHGVPWQFALEILNIISTSSWSFASVHVLLEEFHIFYVKVYRSLARFALEIWTLFLRAVWRCLWRPGGLTGFFGLFGLFSRSSGFFRS